MCYTDKVKQIDALKILETGANVFLTGEPGSGKTYTINQYVSYLRSHDIEPAITASTGIAATHIGGMTIHSWCGIGIKSHLNKAELNSICSNDYVHKRVRAAKVLIIDEISMLPPETLVMIDLICKEVKKSSLPFGGIQVVLVGDFFQLPPVVKKTFNEYSQENLFDEAPSRFAYDGHIWAQTEFTTCYLTEQHRQDDADFLSVLSKIRANDFDSVCHDLISQRKIEIYNIPNQAPKLYSHNVDVDIVNDRMLAKIQSEAKFFPMKCRGNEALIKVMKKGCLSPETLFLKIGASVMFTKNNRDDGYVNGTLGIVDGFDPDSELPIVKIRTGRKIKVSLSDWTVEEDGKMKGRLTQIPLRLAWAITVHKSQGISLDEAVIDLSKVFEYGQGYVALSRVRRLSGIYLLGWNEMAFQVDPSVLRKDHEMRDYSIDAQKMYGEFSDEDILKMQEDFIKICGGKIDTVSVVSKKSKNEKIPTDMETLELWKRRKSMNEIAKIRGLSDKTIFAHIEKLVEAGKIIKTDLIREASPKLLRDLSKIQIAFTILNTGKLTPIYEHFKGTYSYDELKIAKMML